VVLFTGFSPEPKYRSGDIEAVVGKRMTRRYEQHNNVPTSCFDEAECLIYGLTGDRVTQPAGTAGQDREEACKVILICGWPSAAC